MAVKNEDARRMRFAREMGSLEDSLFAPTISSFVLHVAKENPT